MSPSGITSFSDQVVLAKQLSLSRSPDAHHSREKFRLASAHDSNTAIVTFRGANSRMAAVDLEAGAFAVDLVYVANLSDGSADLFPEIVKRAKSVGALVAANPGIRQLSARQEAFRTTLGGIDILSLNRHEAGALVPWLSTLAVGTECHLEEENGLSLPRLAQNGFDWSGGTMTLARFFATIGALGPQWIVVTDGKNGAYVGHRSGIVYCPALRGETVGSAGAGDAFNATFAAFILADASAAEAAIAATINSASVVRHLDTQSGLLTQTVLARQLLEQQSALPIRHWPIR